ncbi:unnamed protein product [marine sediment metagenome]|uniref:Uncharacterized protein n=1 Tax=marine sediment metagenome TaxID=412755 RepID=X1CRA7_9ZZZZ
MAKIKTEFMKCKCKDIAQRGGLNCLCTLRGKKTKIQAENLYVEKR